MFMQQPPKPGPGACVAVDEWERTRTAAPLKTPAGYITGFPAARDVVGHREQLLVHQLFSAGDHRVAAWVARPREPGDQLGQGERALELVHAADDVRGGGLLGWRLLGGEWDDGEGDHDND